MAWPAAFFLPLGWRHREGRIGITRVSIVCRMGVWARRLLGGGKDMLHFVGGVEREVILVVTRNMVEWTIYVVIQITQTLWSRLSGYNGNCNYLSAFVWILPSMQIIFCFLKKSNLNPMLECILINVFFVPCKESYNDSSIFISFKTQVRFGSVILWR